MTEPTLGIRLVLLAFIVLMAGAIVAYHYFMDPPRPGAAPGVTGPEAAPAESRPNGHISLRGGGGNGR